MPSATSILEYLAGASTWARPVAIAWHLVLGTFLSAFAAGWRPSWRATVLIVVALTMSVSSVALLADNPFNAAVFAVLTAALAATARQRDVNVRMAPSRWLAAGAALLAFAWIYPHFTPADPWVRYLYASPLGVIPCPTLAALAGIALLTEGPPKAWRRIVSLAAAAYGVFGVLYLGVLIDVVLVTGAALLVLKVECESQDRFRNEMRITRGAAS